jgi:hypothetical protein
MSRREQLESMLADSPSDTFLRYALAMEWASEESHERSLEIHQGLMKDEPPYVPSFFMGGQQLVQLDRIEEAQQVLATGIEQARQQGDDHAAAEMGEFLASLS